MTADAGERSSTISTSLKPKRRRRGILFSSRKQLNRSRMGRRKAQLPPKDFEETARALSFEHGEPSQLEDEDDHTKLLLVPQEKHSSRMRVRNVVEDESDSEDISPVSTLGCACYN